MTLENKTIDKIMAYLITRPWQEVEMLIHEITNQIAEQQKPKTVEVPQQEPMTEEIV